MKNTNVRQNMLSLTSWLRVDGMALQGCVSNRAKKIPSPKWQGDCKITFPKF